MALQLMKKAESGLLSEELHPQIYELLVKSYRRDTNPQINMFFVAVCSIVFITGDI